MVSVHGEKGDRGKRRKRKIGGISGDNINFWIHERRKRVQLVDKGVESVWLLQVFPEEEGRKRCRSRAEIRFCIRRFSPLAEGKRRQRERSLFHWFLSWQKFRASRRTAVNRVVFPVNIVTPDLGTSPDNHQNSVPSVRWPTDPWRGIASIRLLPFLRHLFSLLPPRLARRWSPPQRLLTFLRENSTWKSNWRVNQWTGRNRCIRHRFSFHEGRVGGG